MHLFLQVFQSKSNIDQNKTKQAFRKVINLIYILIDTINELFKQSKKIKANPL